MCIDVLSRVLPNECIGENMAFVILYKRLRFLRFAGSTAIADGRSKRSSACDDIQLGQFIKRISVLSNCWNRYSMQRSVGSFSTEENAVDDIY